MPVTTKLVREGQYVAEVEVERIEEPEGWAPYLSLEDAQKLDAVRMALREGDLERASRQAKVFRLISVEEWGAEIERRARAAVNGEPGIPWEEVLAAAKRRLDIE
jgi:hypothetical protein